MMSCLIILSKCQDLCLFLGYVWAYSGRHVVDIDFQPLGLKSGCKEGGFWGLRFKNLNLHIFTTQTIHNKYALNKASEIRPYYFIQIKSTHICPLSIPYPLSLEAEVNMGWMPPGVVLFK
jgi:hypothetical protein